MLRFMCLILLAGVMLPAGSVLAQSGTETPAAPSAEGMRFPQPGQALQGSLTILGSIAATGFVRFELQFSYHGDPTGAWFLIAESGTLPESDDLAEWDTGSLTDGIYDLRLVVYRENSEQVYLIPAVRVRNYTPVETNTPMPITPTATTRPGDTPVPTITPTITATPLPSATPSLTPLPANPGEIGRDDLLRSLGNGALLVAGVFALMGVYALLRRIGGRV
jgi:hypothetical protein